MKGLSPEGLTTKERLISLVEDLHFALDEEQVEKENDEARILISLAEHVQDAIDRLHTIIKENLDGDWD